jgi:5-methylcytosine-specific restriction protein A
VALFRSVEQANFAKIVEAHLGLGDGPLLLEGGTGIGKTRAYLSALIASGKRVALVLPTHQLIDQFLHSSDLADTNTAGVKVAAFRPARCFESRTDYQVHREIAQQAQIMLCTSASVIIDHRLGGSYNGSTERDYILFDEADQLPSAAALQRNMEVPGSIIEGLGIKGGTAKELAKAVASATEAEPEHRAAARLILEALDEPAWYQKAGSSDDGGIVLWHSLPGRLLKRIANRPNVAFVSATLTINGRFDDFKRALGIEKESSLSGVIEPERHGDVSFHVVGRNPVNEPGWLEDVVAIIGKAEAPVLVVPSSFDLAVKIGEAVERCVVRQRGETIADVLSRFANSKVLVATAAWAGLDTPVQWKSIVVPTVPFERPTIVDDKIESRYIDHRNMAVRRLRQVIGRGLRSPDAKCTVYFLDPRVTKLPAFWPARFATAWTGRAGDSGVIEGARVEVVLSKAERDPSYKKLALAHYGLHCQACGLVPKVALQIEVHHLDPVSEGVRRTTLEDLRPLCRNCHALAHSRNPPIPIEEMKNLGGRPA